MPADGKMVATGSTFHSVGPSSFEHDRIVIEMHACYSIARKWSKLGKSMHRVKTHDELGSQVSMSSGGKLLLQKELIRVLHLPMIQFQANGLRMANF